MDQFADVTSLGLAFDESQAIEDVFDQFPEDTPTEVIALADADEASSGGVDPVDFETFLDDLPATRGVDPEGDASDGGEPFDVTADELFAD